MAENRPVALILAAGASSRFGGIKALAPWKSGTLLSHIIKIAQTVCPEQVAIVTGAHAKALVPCLRGVQVIHNPQWSQGIGSSLASGIHALESIQPSRILLLLIDQPLVTTCHLRALIETSFTEDRTVLTSNGHYASPPGCLHPRDYSLAYELTGDQGLKSVFESYGLVNAPEVTPDVDTVEELAKIKSYPMPN